MVSHLTKKKENAKLNARSVAKIKLNQTCQKTIIDKLKL